jgi:two-component system sensor histidine kinase AlgZ
MDRSSSPERFQRPILVIGFAAGNAGLIIRLALQWSWGDAFALAAPVALLGSPLWFSAAYLCRAMPIARTPITRLITATAGAAGVSGALWAAVGYAIWRGLQSAGVTLDDAQLQTAIVLLAALGWLGHLLSAAIYYVLQSFRDSTEARQRVLVSEVAHRDAELRALRAQVDPHFRFKSLNSIAGLTTADPARARQMCQMLAEFLRESMAVSASARIPLAREVALAEQYLRVEQVRFGSRLNVSAMVAADSAALLVPPLILQPLVENAVRHGIATMLDGGTVEITVRRSGDRGLIDVRNPRDPDSKRPGTGLGLDLVRRRLGASFGGRASLVIDSTPASYHVSMNLPAEEESR